MERREKEREERRRREGRRGEDGRKRELQQKSAYALGTKRSSISLDDGWWEMNHTQQIVQSHQRSHAGVEKQAKVQVTPGPGCQQEILQQSPELKLLTGSSASVKSSVCSSGLAEAGVETLRRVGRRRLELSCQVVVGGKALAAVLHL